MCLAIPAKVVSIKAHTANVDISGVKRNIDIRLLENVRKGDYVLIHAGCGIEKIDPKLAKETLSLWKSILK